MIGPASLIAVGNRVFEPRLRPVADTLNRPQHFLQGPRLGRRSRVVVRDPFIGLDLRRFQPETIGECLVFVQVDRHVRTNSTINFGIEDDVGVSSHNIGIGCRVIDLHSLADRVAVRRSDVLGLNPPGDDHLFPVPVDLN